MTKLPKLLRNRLFSDNWLLKDKPKKEIRPKDVKRVKVDVSLRKGNRLTIGYVVAPQMFARGKWHYFYADGKPLTSLVRPQSIHGMLLNNLSLNIKNTERLWKRWLTDWIEDNRLSLKVVVPEKSVKVDFNKRKKTPIERVNEKLTVQLPDVQLEDNEDFSPEDIF